MPFSRANTPKEAKRRRTGRIYCPVRPCPALPNARVPRTERDDLVKNEVILVIGPQLDLFLKALGLKSERTVPDRIYITNLDNSSRGLS